MPCPPTLPIFRVYSSIYNRVVRGQLLPLSMTSWHLGTLPAQEWDRTEGNDTIIPLTRLQALYPVGASIIKGHK